MEQLMFRLAMAHVSVLSSYFNVAHL